MDVWSSRGAIGIFEESDGKYFGGIGTELAGNLVIVSWNSALHISATGSLQVGYAAKKVY